MRALCSQWLYMTEAVKMRTTKTLCTSASVRVFVRVNGDVETAE